MYVSLRHLFWVGYNNTQKSCTNETSAVVPVQDNLAVWLWFTQKDYQEEAGVNLNQPQHITEESYDNELGTGWTQVYFISSKGKDSFSAGDLGTC